MRCDQIDETYAWFLKHAKKEASKEPFLVVNKVGLPVTLVLGDHKNYSFSVTSEQAGSQQVEVDPDCQQSLHLKFNRHNADNSYRTYVSPLSNQNVQGEAMLKIKKQLPLLCQHTVTIKKKEQTVEKVLTGEAAATAKLLAIKDTTVVTSVMFLIVVVVGSSNRSSSNGCNNNSSNKFRIRGRIRSRSRNRNGIRSKVGSRVGNL